MRNPNTTTDWNENSKLWFEWLSGENEIEILTTLQQDKDYEVKENLIWNTDAILEDLKKNCVTVEPKDTEMMWYKWKKVHINLPAVWNFEWFKFDYFVSNEAVKKDNFENKQELEKESYSMENIAELLQAINKYMTELQGTNEEEMDYENELKYRKTGRYFCFTWEYLKAISWLNKSYWLNDKYIEWKKDSRAVRDCTEDQLFFNHFNYGIANLFLKCSD